MLGTIDRDVGRFKKIVRGKIKSKIKKYISSGELIGKKGKELISIPLPELEIPHFKLGNRRKKTYYHYGRIIP